MLHTCLTFINIVEKLSIFRRWFLFGMITDVNSWLMPKYLIKEFWWVNVIWNVCLIYSNSKFVVICKKVYFEFLYIRIHTKEKSSYISNIAFAILPF